VGRFDDTFFGEGVKKRVGGPGEPGPAARLKVPPAEQKKKQPARPGPQGSQANVARKARNRLGRPGRGFQPGRPSPTRGDTARKDRPRKSKM